MTGAEFGAILLSALSAGAAASLKDSAADAVKSAYEALKARVADLLGRVGEIDTLANPEENPEEVAHVSDKIQRKAASADEEERATLGELIIQLKDILDAHGQDTAEISEMRIELLRTKVKESDFHNKDGGKMITDATDSEFERVKFVNDGKKSP